MGYPDTFTGYQVPGPAKATELVFNKTEFKPKPFEDHDVDVQIQACGVCGSDLHTITGGWGDQKWPLCVGHEVIGTAVRVGPKVTLVKEGQRVGVGAQIWSCLECKQCKEDNETYCRHQVDTYGAPYPSGDISQGGYASHIRAHEFWVYPIPAALDTVQAAPMLCAGITAYSPLVRNGAGRGKKVGVVGLGGIGHFALLWSVALGAETWVISRSHAKEADARQMGAAGFLATGDGPGWNDDHRMTFDLIVNTANSADGFDLNAYLALLDVHGRFISVGLPEGEGFRVKSAQLLSNGCLMGASHLGSRREMLEMLQLAADKGVKSWVEEVKISEGNLSKSLARLHKSDVRYRFTLTGYEEAFGK
jgi:alcohol dehydrogenase (NADP+)